MEEIREVLERGKQFHQMYLDIAIDFNIKKDITFYRECLQRINTCIDTISNY